MGILLKPTTKAKKMPGSNGAGTDLTFAKYRNGANNAWVNCTFIKRRNATNDGWIWAYSTPDVTVSGGGAATGSGASGAGSAYVQAFAADGGVHSPNYRYDWSYVSGDGAITPDNAVNHYNPIFSRAFSGVANGSTSAGVSAVWRCTITDTDTGAQAYADITIGPLAWQNTIPSFSPHTNTYTAGSGTEYVPAGATSLTIRRIGGAGGGGNGVYNSGLGDYKGGNGGGSGAYTAQTIAIAPGDASAPIYWSVGAGVSLWPNTGGTSSTTGSVAAGSVNGNAPGGTGGASGAAVVAGSSTGGSPNGNNGTNGSLGVAGVGGASPYGGYGKGGDGGYPGGGAVGGNGAIIFEWS